MEKYKIVTNEWGGYSAKRRYLLVFWHTIINGLGDANNYQTIEQAERLIKDDKQHYIMRGKSGRIIKKL